MRQELSDLQKSIEENGEVIKKITTGLKQFELVAAQKGIDVSKDSRRTELLRAKMKTQADIAESQKAVDRLERTGQTRGKMQRSVSYAKCIPDVL